MIKCNKIFFLTVCLITSCNKVKTSTNKETNIDKLVVKKVDLNIDTAVSVDCNSFASTFNNEIKLSIIRDKNILNEFDDLIKESRNSKRNIHVDTRKQIIVFYTNMPNDTLCVDKFNMMLNSKLLEKQKKLFEFVNDL